MYMCVHFFTVCCFWAAGVGPLAAARDPATERDRTCLCHGACLQLLVPTATMAPVQSLAHTGTRSSELLRASLVPPRRRWCCVWHLCPACCWFTVMMLGRQQGPRVPALAVSSTRHPAPPSRRTEKALSFLRNVFVFSLWAAEPCPSPCGTGPPSSQVLCNSRALS